MDGIRIATDSVRDLGSGEQFACDMVTGGLNGLKSVIVSGSGTVRAHARCCQVGRMTVKPALLRLLTAVGSADDRTIHPVMASNRCVFPHLSGQLCLVVRQQWAISGFIFF